MSGIIKVGTHLKWVKRITSSEFVLLWLYSSGYFTLYCTHDGPSRCILNAAFSAGNRPTVVVHLSLNLSLFWGSLLAFFALSKWKMTHRPANNGMSLSNNGIINSSNWQYFRFRKCIALTITDFRRFGSYLIDSIKSSSEVGINKLLRLWTYSKK